jgi:hypothetical protein
MLPADPASQPLRDPAAARRRRANLIIVVVAALTVLVPFLFWKDTWFGRSLTDQETAEYLTDKEKPRHAQHALVQLAERIERGDPAALQWYPDIVALRDTPVTELRVTLAWVLGMDNRSELFHKTLLQLLQDRDAMVRRNAALSLVRFGDAGGRKELLDMLRPQAVVAPASGTLRRTAGEGTSLDQQARLARIETPAGDIDVRTLSAGAVVEWRKGEGEAVKQGDELAVLSPPEEHVWEALRALYLVGRPDDLPAVQQFSESGSARIREQATLTAAAIRRRAAAGSGEISN